MKIRTAIKLLVIILIVSQGFSCKSNKSDMHDKVITVSILPFKYFVEGIAGKEYFVNVIVPPGASPATFEPPPSVIRSLQHSELLVFNGYLGFEQAWMDKLMQVNPDIKTLFLAENQDLLAASEHKHGDHFHYEGVDPHFWMSPLSAKIIASDIFNFMVLNYPEDSTIFRINLDNLMSEITETDIYLDSVFSGLENRSFLIFHPALSYMARDYNLTQIPIEFEGKEPSASWLGEVIKMARADSIKTIMVQKEFNRKSAETIAAEIGGNVIDIQPLSDEWVKSVKGVADSISEMRRSKK